MDTFTLLFLCAAGIWLLACFLALTVFVIAALWESFSQRSS